MRPIKVGFDAQSLTGKNQTGLGVYSLGLSKVLERHPETINLRRLWPKGRRVFRRTHERLIWEQYHLVMAAIREEVDIIHTPCFSVPRLSRIPKVVTAHDLIIRKHPSWMPAGSRWYFSKWIPSSYRSADHIIAVSSATRDDLVNLLHIDPGRITVIYHGVNPVFKRNTDPHDINRIRYKYHVPMEFFMMVGSFEPRKNIKVALGAFSRIVDRSPQLKLLLVGQHNDYVKSILEKAKELDIEDRVLIPGYVPDLELAVLYSVETALLFPSSAEGFGLPIVEAMATGCPVIGSDISVFHEVGGDAVSYVPVGDPAALAEEMARMLEDQERRAGFVLNSLARSLKFNWDHAAEETVRVYLRVLAKRGVEL